MHSIVASALCRRVAAAFHQRSCRRLLRASLHAWQAAAAARRQRRHQLEHARLLLQRRLMGRLLAGWRRATLAGKLCHTLGVVQQLQAAVDRVREELAHKAQQVGWGLPACRLPCWPSCVPPPTGSSSCDATSHAQQLVARVVGRPACLPACPSACLPAGVKSADSQAHCGGSVAGTQPACALPGC
jgi:hypothetical protein